MAFFKLCAQPVLLARMLSALQQWPYSMEARWNLGFARPQVGALVWGTVRRVEPYGVFVGLDGTRFSGLLHISCISRAHVEATEVRSRPLASRHVGALCLFVRCFHADHILLDSCASARPMFCTGEKQFLVFLHVQNVLVHIREECTSCGCEVVDGLGIWVV
jgi:hypothetical protein